MAGKNTQTPEEQLDKPSFFSIESTMEAGMGSAELLKDLLAPETASGNPEELNPIIHETTGETTTLAEKKTKVKVTTGETTTLTTGETTTIATNLISDLLSEGEEEEEVETTGETTTVASEGTENEDEEPSPFTALAKDLFKLNVFTLDEDETEEPEIKTPEEFRDRFLAEKQKGSIEMVQNFIGKFGEDYQNAFDAIFVKGVNPKDYFGVYNKVVDFAQMDMTKEDNQETVVRQALADQEFEPEDITTEIERLKSYGDLATVAAKHHKVLVKKEALKLQQMEQKAEVEQQQKAATRNQYIQNVEATLQEKLKTKEFDGIPINPKLANELHDFLLVNKWKTPSGEELTDFDRAILELKRPENHATKVKIGLLLKIMEKDPTLSTIQKTAVTKKTNTLFAETARQKSQQVTQKKEEGAANRWFVQ